MSGTEQIDILADMTSIANKFNRVVASVEKAGANATAKMNALTKEAEKTLADMRDMITKDLQKQRQENKENFNLRDEKLSQITERLAKLCSDYSGWAKRVNKENADFQAFIKEHIQKHMVARDAFRELKKEEPAKKE